MGNHPARSRVSRWVVVILFGIFAGYVIYNSFEIPGQRCEVCMSFRGQSACRTVEGATAAEARRAAIDNACARLASGVTDSIACANGKPVSASCGPAR